MTPALIAVGVWFRKELSVPQALAAYAIGPVLGLVAGTIWFAVWKLGLDARPLLGSARLDQLIPFVVGTLVAYVSPFLAVRFRKGRALAMGIVALLAPVVVALIVNGGLRYGAGGGVEALWLSLLVVIPTTFCVKASS